MASNSTLVTKISIDDINCTYYGEQGCACGCGGEYQHPENGGDELATALKHLAEINARLKSNAATVQQASSYFSIEGATRATRIYFKNGIHYAIKDGNLFRTETIAE
jgi:hypothetical protein